MRHFNMMLWLFASAGCQGVVTSSVLDDGGGIDASIDASVDASTDAGRRVPVGMPVPACADAGDPSLSANERYLLSLPADSWGSAPGSKMYDTCKGAATYGDGVYLVTGCQAIIDSWGGGAYDSARQKFIIWGGGHGDYGGNELYAFNMKTFAWEQLTTPSRPPFSKDPLDDGNPVSRHTYDGVEFIPFRGTIFGWGGARSSDGNGTGLTWEFEPTAKTWTNLGAPEPRVSSLYDFGLAHDPITKKIFVHSHAILVAYDFTTNTWSHLENFGFPPYTGVYDSWQTRVGAIDPTRRLFVTMGGGSAVLVYNIDTAKVLSLTAPWNALSSDQAFLKEHAPGLDFDVASSQLVAWAGGAPMALETRATPYQWVARSSMGAPAAAQSRGTYGRWRYAERYNVFVLVNDANQDVYFYKHTAGCGQ